MLTNLGRWGSPLIRYRTRDLVQINRTACPCGRPFVLLDGGVLGRADDMTIIRGVNVFPSALENVLREFGEIEEFRVEISTRDSMQQMKLVLEPRANETTDNLAARVEQRVRERIGLRAEVEVAPVGSLPRFELKAKRFYNV